ncbi:unnamed protein product [Lactuca saligna]|uniref:SWIM-type domain-containing protein n=1 Tax=Lactuca saligna TaxID=75948 RepID=A0AA36EG32_LACSI|nr:unnamed protein product [Lactuca saligna]
MERDPKSWCRAFFEVDRACDAYENGISESFNSIIDLARKGHSSPCWKILGFMQWRGCIFWGVIPSGIQQYEVRIGNDGYVVDLNNNTCGCRSWQVSGIPCVHAVVAISYLNRNVEDYVAPWFHTTMFLTCYNHTINPLNGSSMWPEVPYMKPLPPQKRRLPGRPTLKRKRDQSERESQGKTRHNISKSGNVEPVQVELVQVEAVQVDPIQVDAPAQPIDDVQIDPAPHVDVQVDDLVNDVPTQPVATGKWTRKCSERITKIGSRRKVLKKEGSNDHHPMVLE